MEGLSKKGKELMDMDSSVVIVEGRREWKWKRVWGINNNGINTIKNKIFKYF